MCRLFEKVSVMLNFVNRGCWRDCKAWGVKGFFPGGGGLLCRLQCAGDPEELTCGEVPCWQASSFLRTSSGPGVPGLCRILGHCTPSPTEVHPSPAGWGANFQVCSFLGHFPLVLKAATALVSWLFLLSSESPLTG